MSIEACEAIRADSVLVGLALEMLRSNRIWDLNGLRANTDKGRCLLAVTGEWEYTWWRAVFGICQANGSPDFVLTF